MGEVAVPEIVAEQLTIPETVNIHNINYLQELVDNDKANFYIRKNNNKRINLKYALNERGTEVLIDDVILRNGKEIKVENLGFKLQQGDRIIREGVVVEGIKYPGKKQLTIQIGDTVERQLQNGDYVLLNRQPDYVLLNCH